MCGYNHEPAKVGNVMIKSSCHKPRFSHQNVKSGVISSWDLPSTNHDTQGGQLATESSCQEEAEVTILSNQPAEWRHAKAILRQSRL